MSATSKNRTRWAAAALVASCVAGPAVAGGRTGALFLTENPSARLVAIDGAGTAFVSDAAAPFVNPAGLAAASERQVLLTHSQGLVDTTFEAFSVVSPAADRLSLDGAAATDAGGSRWAWSASGLYQDYGRFQGRNEAGDETGSFSASDLSLTLGAARKLGDRLSIGLGLKAIREQLGSAGASGWAADVGATALTPIRHLAAGFALSNMGPSMRMPGGAYALPTTAKTGLAYRLEHVSVVADWSVSIHGQGSSLGIGTEIRPASVLALRMGYIGQMSASAAAINGQNALARFAGVDAGVGLRLGAYTLDYALMPHETLNETHRISLSTTF